MATPLSRAALPLLRHAAVPNYDVGSLTAGIVHFGVGNFHRAHQAVYLDRLFNAGRDHDFALLGAGLMPGDARMRAALERQDWMTTVVEQSAGASKARVTAPMVGFVPVADIAAMISALADPAIKIVSLTVTEGGYFLDGNGTFDPTIAAVAADGANPEAPRTTFGLIAAALAQRKGAGLAPFTVMSCDNIPHNGAVCRSAVTGTAQLSDPALADWIAQNVAFPNGMVDRITPATGEREKAICAETFDIDDAWPVFCEDFSQWVLEDVFPTGRPGLEDVGVEFVSDVSPFEAMKIRILNGGHALLAYPAGLLGIEFVHEAMAHPLVRGFLEKVERDEIIPVVPPVPNTSLDTYFSLIVQRFANPKIGDTVRRLCLDGSNRQPKFIVPPIADRLSTGAGIAGLALASALWCRYCAGTRDDGAPIAPNDPNWADLTVRAKAAKDNPDVWLEMASVYGSVADAEVFRGTFSKWLAALWRDGTARTLERYIAGEAGV